MQRIDIDGVPVFTAPGPERVTGALVFGVGIRDETFATLGITHLIEHLVMGTLPKSHLDCNATVDVEATTFFATGRPAAVAAFLTSVCTALSDLPTDRMEQEVGIIGAENCPGSHPTAAALWASRFRLTGPGLAYAGGGVPEGLTEDEVRAHARRWFVRGNAVAIWHGDVPSGLRLPLPDGLVPERSRPVVRPQDGPVWTQGPVPGAGLLITATDPLDGALNLAVDVLQERMRDVARRERGLSYHAELEIVDVAPGHREIALVVDAREGQEAAVAQVVWEQYRDLCDRGPTPAEIDHAVAGFEDFLDDGDDVVAAALSRAAFGHLFGLPSSTDAERLLVWRAVTPASAAAALRATVPSAVLILPEEVGTASLDLGIPRQNICNRVSALPQGTVFRPPVWARAVSKQARHAIVVGHDVLAFRDPDGDVHAIPWVEVEAVVPAAEGEGMFVVGSNLCAIDVHADVYGRRAVEAVRARLPRDRWVARSAPTPEAPRTAAPVG